MKSAIWWDDSSNIADLVEYLVAKNGPMATADITWLLRSPWKRDAEYKAMRRGETQEKRSA